MCTTRNGLIESIDDKALIDLVLAMARQEHDALTELYNATVHRIYALALSITSNKADAEEVVCDVYWQAWRQAAQFDVERGEVLAWLQMIARTRSLDKRRRRQSKLMFQDCDFDLTGVAAEDRASDEQIICDEQSKALHQALQRLPAPQRQLIDMSFFGDMSHQEIADCLTLPLGTVKSHIRRGMIVLRQELSGLQWT